MLVAMLCGVWVYVGFLGTEHGGAITSTIQQLLTGTVSTLTEVPTVRTEVAAVAARTGADRPPPRRLERRCRSRGFARA
jgi:hypothetical protein